MDYEDKTATVQDWIDELSKFPRDLPVRVEPMCGPPYRFYAAEVRDIDTAVGDEDVRYVRHAVILVLGD